MNHVFRVLARSVNDLFQAIGPLIFANLLWLALSLPLITAPAAGAGLYYFVALTIRGEEPSLASFWDGFRRYFVRSGALAALNLAVLIVLLVNFLFYLGQANEGVRLIAIPMFYLLVLWLCVQTYLAPLMLQAEWWPDARQDRPGPWALFKRAIRLTLAEPAFTLFVALAVLAWMALSVALAGPILILSAAGVALIRTRATLTILGQEPEPLKPGWK
ncbi:MAG: DUF624 domain-containing protein [Chloroflexota bacterium]